MRDDDEILEAYENEFEPSPDPEPARRSNRGFWLVTCFLGLACALVLVLIAVNRPIKDTIAHAESTLRDSQSAAQRIHDRSGSYANAIATTLAAADPSNTYRDGGSASTGLDDVSIATGPGSWAAAVQARPG